MSDAVWFAKHGIPAVVYIHTTFEPAARNYNRIQKTNVPLLIVPRPTRQATDEAKRELIEGLLPQIVDGLTKGPFREDGSWQ